MQSRVPHRCCPPRKYAENTTTSHHLSQAHRFPRAARECGTGLGLPSTSKCFPGCCRPSICFIQASAACEVGPAAQHLNFLGNVVPVVQGYGDPACHQGSAHVQIPPDQCDLTWPFGGLNPEKVAPSCRHVCQAPHTHTSVLLYSSLGLRSCRFSTTDQVSACK